MRYFTVLAIVLPLALAGPVTGPSFDGRVERRDDSSYNPATWEDKDTPEYKAQYAAGTCETRVHQDSPDFEKCKKVVTQCSSYLRLQNRYRYILSEDCYGKKMNPPKDGQGPKFDQKFCDMAKRFSVLDTHEKTPKCLDKINEVLKDIGVDHFNSSNNAGIDKLCEPNWSIFTEQAFLGGCATMVKYLLDRVEDS